MGSVATINSTECADISPSLNTSCDLILDIRGTFILSLVYTTKCQTYSQNFTIEVPEVPKPVCSYIAKAKFKGEGESTWTGSQFSSVAFSGSESYLGGLPVTNFRTARWVVVKAPKGSFYDVKPISNSTIVSEQTTIREVENLISKDMITTTTTKETITTIYKEFELDRSGTGVYFFDSCIDPDKEGDYIVQFELGECSSTATLEFQAQCESLEPVGIAPHPLGTEHGRELFGLGSEENRLDWLSGPFTQTSMLEDNARIAVATFMSPLISGTFIFRQENFEAAIKIYVQYKSDSNSNTSMDHRWGIYDGDTTTEFWEPMNCAKKGILFKDYCRTNTHKKSSLCETGDVSEEHGLLNISSQLNSYKFEDNHLTLYGDNSIVGKSIVIFGSNQTSDVLACASIKEYSYYIVALNSNQPRRISLTPILSDKLIPWQKNALTYTWSWSFNGPRMRTNMFTELVHNPTTNIVIDQPGIYFVRMDVTDGCAQQGTMILIDVECKAEMPFSSPTISTRSITKKINVQRNPMSLSRAISFLFETRTEFGDVISNQNQDIVVSSYTSPAMMAAKYPRNIITPETGLDGGQVASIVFSILFIGCGCAFLRYFLFPLLNKVYYQSKQSQPKKKKKPQQLPEMEMPPTKSFFEEKEELNEHFDEDGLPTPRTRHRHYQKLLKERKLAEGIPDTKNNLRFAFKKEGLPRNWIKLSTNDGVVYYYHLETKQVSKSFPTDETTSSLAAGSTTGLIAGGSHLVSSSNDLETKKKQGFYVTFHTIYFSWSFSKKFLI